MLLGGKILEKLFFETLIKLSFIASEIAKKLNAFELSPLTYFNYFN